MVNVCLRTYSDTNMRHNGSKKKPFTLSAIIAPLRMTALFVVALLSLSTSLAAAAAQRPSQPSRNDDIIPASPLKDLSPVQSLLTALLLVCLS